MRTITPYEIRDNLFSAIDRDWMLITAVDRSGKVNTMTASWGGFGILWNKPVCFCFIRPQRYTKRFVDEAESFTLSFFPEGYREALTLLGTVSGRERDKIAESGLHTVTEEGIAYFKEARLVVVSKKLYADELKEENFLDLTVVSNKYPQKDFHTVYVCEIRQVLTADCDKEETSV